jgi:hypothetical protein
MFFFNFRLVRKFIGGFWFKDTDGWHQGSEDFYNAKIQQEFSEESEYHG